jgi:hypothetical protein
MNIDHRSFHYTLEPLQRRQTWRLEALESRLRRANQHVACAAQELEVRTRRMEVQHEQVLVAATHQVDPAFQRRSLLWLAQLREGLAIARTELVALQATRSLLQEAYVIERNKLAAIDRHREDSLAAYTVCEQSRQASADDVDWLTRVQVTALEQADLGETA